MCEYLMHHSCRFVNNGHCTKRKEAALDVLKRHIIIEYHGEVLDRVLLIRIQTFVTRVYPECQCRF